MKGTVTPKVQDLHAQNLLAIYDVVLDIEAERQLNPERSGGADVMWGAAPFGFKGAGFLVGQAEN